MACDARDPGRLAGGHRAAPAARNADRAARGGYDPGRRQLANLRDLFADADIAREEYIGRKRALMASLNGGLPQPTYSEAVLVRAARLLADLGDLWAKATPTERAEIAGGLFAEVRVHDDRIVSATLARDEYLLLVASATARDQVGVARPEGSEHTPPTFVIEGVAELTWALRAA